MHEHYFTLNRNILKLMPDWSRNGTMQQSWHLCYTENANWHWRSSSRPGPKFTDIILRFILRCVIK